MSAEKVDLQKLAELAAQTIFDGDPQKAEDLIEGSEHENILESLGPGD